MKFKMITIGPTIPEKKEPQPDGLVCYCFEYTKKNIEDDYQTNGYSRILEKIQAEKKNKGCNCEVKNPKRK